MNICIITSSFPSRKDDLVQAPFLIPFIKGLQRRGHRVFIFTQDRQGDKELFLEDVQVRWFPWMRADKPLVHLNPIHPLDGLRIGSLFLQGRKEILRFAGENKIDACLALWVLPSGAFAYHAHQRKGIPYSVWALGSDIYRYGKTPVLRWMMKSIVGGARGMFADGFDISRRVEEQFGRPCCFLATTRPLDRSSRDVACNGDRDVACNISTTDPYRFRYVGRLEKVKGIDLLLRAVALLRSEKANLHLAMIGRGEMDGWAKEFVLEKGLSRTVSFMGNVSDEALALHYESSDCVVIPSRSESIPLVFSEALQFDREIIVTDVGDMGTLGRQYGVAEVVDPEDPGALKEAMMRKIKSAEKKEKPVQNGRVELKHLFDIENSVERFLKDYS